MIDSASWVTGQLKQLIWGGVRELRGVHGWSHPLRRVRVAEMIRLRMSNLVQEAVEEARAEGASWADIGMALDVSRQAAQQRFGVADEKRRRS